MADPPDVRYRTEGGRLGRRAFIAGGQALLAGSRALLAGSRALLAGSRTLLAGSRTLLAGSRTLLAGRHAPLARQFASFVRIGLAATAVHYAVLVGAVQLGRAAPVPSALIGYCCGGFVSYALNRRHTFRSDRPHGEAVWRFALVAGAGFLLTFALLALLIDGAGVPYLAAQVATTGVVMFWTFAANRAWTFAAER